jgi:hypothetical protein
LQSHIDAYTDDLIRNGMPPQEARRQARIEFGSVEQTKGDCRTARGISLVETVTQDLRYAFRTQCRSWGFTLVAVPTLALGIGGATAIFSVVKAVIFNPLPFREPGNLVHVWEGPSGVGHVSTHTMRHTYRSWLDAVGTPIAVQQKLMRHADIRTTMSVYGDVVTDEMSKAHSKVVSLALALNGTDAARKPS